MPGTCGSAWTICPSFHASAGFLMTALALHAKENWLAGHGLHTRTEVAVTVCLEMDWQQADTLTWMRGTTVHLMRQLLLRMPLAVIEGHWRVHAQGIRSGKVRRQLQLPILQCVLHAHEAICLGCGQRCQVGQLQKHLNTPTRYTHLWRPCSHLTVDILHQHPCRHTNIQQLSSLQMAKGLEEVLYAWQNRHCGGGFVAPVFSILKTSSGVSAYTCLRQGTPCRSHMGMCGYMGRCSDTGRSAPAGQAVQDHSPPAGFAAAHHGQPPALRPWAASGEQAHCLHLLHLHASRAPQGRPAGLLIARPFP